MSASINLWERMNILTCLFSDVKVGACIVRTLSASDIRWLHLLELSKNYASGWHTPRKIILCRYSSGLDGLAVNAREVKKIEQVHSLEIETRTVATRFFFANPLSIQET